MVRKENRSDVHTEGKRIRKEIFRRTKKPLQQKPFSEKLSKIEILH